MLPTGRLPRSPEQHPWPSSPGFTTFPALNTAGLLEERGCRCGWTEVQMWVQGPVRVPVRVLGCTPRSTSLGPVPCPAQGSGSASV